MAGIETPWQYSGAAWIGIVYDHGRGEAYWEDTAPNCNEYIEYFPLLEGDRDRAVKEARRLIREFESE